MEECHRSSAALYARLIDDIRNDTTRLSQFFETAGRVIDIDQKREKSLAYVSESSKARPGQCAAPRARERACGGDRALEPEDRVLAYQYVLERLVIETPMSQAVDVERLLNQLKSTIARYQTPAADLAARAEFGVVQLTLVMAGLVPANSLRKALRPQAGSPEQDW